MLIDTHAHLNFNAFKDDADEVIRRCLENDIWTINVGTQYETSKKALELAGKYKGGVFASVGLHPIHLETGLVKIKNDEEEIEIKTAEQEFAELRSSYPQAKRRGRDEQGSASASAKASAFDYEKYKELTRNQKVVAIGEIGLDYYWKPKNKRKLELFKERQKSVLRQQLDVAKELNLPAILHCRMAHNDLIEILNYQLKTKNYKLRGVIHCFTGNLEQAKKFLEMGFYLGFNGIIFKNIAGINFDDVIKNTPLDRILLETDCPYLTPPQAEGRNEPLNLKYIAKEIANTKDIALEEVSRVATRNAKSLFKLA